MNRTMCRTLVVMLLATSLPAIAQQGTLSICDYEPPESRISDLGIQGSFNWSDGPYADGRNRALSASLVADYEGLFSSGAFGQVLNAHTEVRGANDGWTADLSGAGSLRAFFTSDLFGVGVVGLDASTRTGLGIDLTGGVGTGRFRDVSPLAQAILIQNALLDIGELLAPVANDTLLDLAQILGEDGPTDDEKVVRLAERLIATELVPGTEIGVRGLLAIEKILQSSGETRLCGRDVQVRLGASAILLPEFSLAATGVLLARFAVVPDPVSQFDSSVEAKSRLARPEEMSIEANVSYARFLPDGWTGRASCRMTIDRMWTKPDATVVSYVASGSLTTKVFGSVGLSLVGNALYSTGDEEMTFSLVVLLEADLF
ncbi:MAG: hypothetical protein NTY63_09195 [Candidatus Bipolaricaulota bacterium]|nr:hypothetical protein [Candidatus Bipolaricaulota bacterium]